MAWQERTTVSLRWEFCALATAEGVGMAELCRRFGISRKTGYKWLRRFFDGCERVDRSRRPHSSPPAVARGLEEAMNAAEREHFDFAILDINLNGTMVYPLADQLLARGIPFLFLTGYSLSNLPERFRPVTRLSKPCDPDLLIATLRSQL